MNLFSTAVLAAAVAAAFYYSTALGDDVRIVRGTLKVTQYDGVTDDLLSAGLNLDGLVNPVAPGFVDPLNPSAAELRRRAIYNNYRAIVDPAPAGGMGVLWGPQSAGTPRFPRTTFGLIPGVEYKAYLQAREPHPHVNNIPAAVQIPRHFKPNKACIVLAAPSGSRSLYGAIAIAEWALFKGCAVALPGKGTDTGFHLLGEASSAHAVTDLDGIARSVQDVGDNAQFALHSTPSLEAYVAANPDRVATKHAHSQINPERLWGEFALRGIEFAFWALNDHFRGERFTPENTLVIAAGASNGGGMALRALEDDERGLIDGLVVTEPNIQPRDGRFTIKFGTEAPFDPRGRTLYDSITTMSVFASCAALSPTLAGTPFFVPIGTPGAIPKQNRCAALKAKDLVSGTTTEDQAASALAKIRDHGYALPQDWGIASHDAIGLWRSLQVTYANAYGRFAVEDNLCGMSFAATAADSKPAPLSQANAKKLFADSNGVPETAGVNIIADKAANGPIREIAALSSSTGAADFNIDAALCFRSLQTGEGIGHAGGSADFARVQAGTAEVQTTARLRGKPAIIIHGREDALIFPNLHSRAYYALNQEEEGKNSRLSYIEVTPGQHFDAFISNLFVRPGTTEAQFAPLHYYFVKAMDSIYAHLTTGKALPPSQVVRPTPRGAQAYDLHKNVKDLLPNPVAKPAEADRITFKGGVLTIPQ